MLNEINILSAQGEREAQSINGTTITADLYETEKIGLIEAWKTDLDIDHYFQFELGAHNLGTGESDWADIRQAQNNAVASLSYAHMVFTDAKDFPDESKMSDNLHYNQTGYNEMGTTGATNAAQNTTATDAFYRLPLRPSFDIDATEV